MSTEMLIHRFYTCFQSRDYKGMQDCYADNAQFSDPVFRHLSAPEVRAMWEMLCKRAKDLALDFSILECTPTEAKAQWLARYSFAQTGRRVVNRIHSRFQLRDGKIIKQVDSFSFYRWSAQALGLPGLLLGWTPYLRSKVRRSAMQGLKNFMKTAEAS